MEFCGAADKHPYELFLQLNEIEHRRTKAKSPQTNGICERAHQTLLNEFYRVTFRKKVYSNQETLQVDLDENPDRKEALKIRSLIERRFGGGKKRHSLGRARY